MPQKSMLFALVLTLLLAVGVAVTHGFDVQAADVTFAHVVNDSGTEQDAPAKIRSSAEEPRAHQPETPRRLDAPERQLADFGSRIVSVQPDGIVRVIARSASEAAGNVPATPLHLRHCVFLC